MAKRKRKDDEELVNIWPHLQTCGVIVLLGMVTGDRRLIYAALLTLVAFVVFIGLAVWLSE